MKTATATLITVTVPSIKSFLGVGSLAYITDTAAQ